MKKQSRLFIKGFKRGVAPLVNSLPSPLTLKWWQRGVLEGLHPSKEKIFPLPLIKGKGIKGIGLPNKNLKGVRGWQIILNKVLESA